MPRQHSDFTGKNYNIYIVSIDVCLRRFSFSTTIILYSFNLKQTIMYDK